VIALILFAQAGICGLLYLVFDTLKKILLMQDEARRQHLADSMATTRIEHAAEALVRVCQTESDATRAHVGDHAEKTNSRVDALVEAMRTVVHETPDFAITGEDGEVPVRRMRGLRSALARMEEMSRQAAGE